jgi:SAM-dependent methyltransferase
LERSGPDREEQRSATREEILWCYRNLLGREPESDAAVASHSGNKNFQDLVEGFIRSPEFAERLCPPPSSLGKNERFYPFDLKRNEVEVVATDGQMLRAIGKIKAAWTYLGLTRPHYSVITENQFLPENFQGSVESFWDSGQVEAAEVQRVLERHRFGNLSDRVCVEYGCGVGRVTMGFSSRFSRVHGYDISPGHLEYAKRRAHEIGVTNVSFHLCPDDALTDLEECDFFYSRIVFQHNPPPVISGLIKKVVSALRPEGIAIFQVPTYGFGYRFCLEEWLNADHALDIQMHCLPQEHVFALLFAGNCLPLEVREDNSTGAPEMYISSTFVVRKCAQAVERNVGWADDVLSSDEQPCLPRDN